MPQDTPITDAAEICVQLGFKKTRTGQVSAELCREIETVNAELLAALKGCMNLMHGDVQYSPEYKSAEQAIAHAKEKT